MKSLVSLCCAAIVENAELLENDVKGLSNTLKSVVLSEAAKHDFLRPALAASVFHGSSHDCLDLSGAKLSLTDQVVTSFAKYPSSVTKLDLSKSPEVRLTAWNRLASSLVESLAFLDLSQSGSKGLMGSFASRCVHLKTVKAEGCLEVTNADVISILSRCSMLQELSLRRCSKLTNTCLVRGLPLRSYLLRLDLRDCRLLTDPALHAIALRCPVLMSLSLESQQFVNGGLTAVREEKSSFFFFLFFSCVGD
jgi:hypothetical protein